MEKELEEIDNEIIKLYIEDYTLDDIAIKTNKSKRTIYRRIRKLKDQGLICERLDNKDKKIIEMYKKGADAKEIAEKLEVHRDTVYERLGILRDKGYINENDIIDDIDRKIITMHIENKTVPEMVTKTGISIPAIYKRIVILKDKGIIKQIDNFDTNIKTIIVMYAKGKSVDEISKQVDYSKQEIENEIKILKDSNFIGKKFYVTKTNVTKVKKNKPKKERKKYYECKIREAEEVKEIVESLKNSKGNVRVVHGYIENEKEKFKKGEFEENRIQLLNDSICFLFYDTKIEEVTFVMKTYIKYNKYEECLQFLNNAISINHWKDDEKEKLLKFKLFVKDKLKELRKIERMQINLNTDTETER